LPSFFRQKQSVDARKKAIRMFVLKKLVAAFILPPGLFISLLLLFGLGMIRRRPRYPAVASLCLAALVYLLSIAPVAQLLIRPLEQDYRSLPIPRGDVIVVLGGGIIDRVPDLTGTGAPSQNMLPRVVTAARLHQRLGVPVLVSGGSIRLKGQSEAAVARRFLTDLGVPRRMVIVEGQSRDTLENALFTKVLLKTGGYRNPVLVTSAYHMKRAVRTFERIGLNVTPFPSDFFVPTESDLIWKSWLPTAESLWVSKRALHEYVGLVYYRLAGRRTG
jgi:uncharacterized SAM-binding protein YcdF (DUF218 family)